MPSWVVTTPKLKRAPVGLAEAIKAVQQSARARFDETLELSLNLGIDPRRGDQMVRGAATLPHGTGRSVRVCVFAKDDAAQQARDAGAHLLHHWLLCCGLLRCRLLCCRPMCAGRPAALEALGSVCWHVCNSAALCRTSADALLTHPPAVFFLTFFFIQVPRWWGMTT